MVGCSKSDNTITCSLGTLASGEGMVVFTTVTAGDAGTITSVATISSEVLDGNAANDTPPRPQPFKTPPVRWN